MKHRHLGNTDMDLSVISYGASSLGAEFRSVDVDEALAAVPAAIECGMNFIDTSPYYGRGSGEVLLGIALKDIPRDQYYLGTKLGRYHAAHLISRLNELLRVSTSACIDWAQITSM